ncbi:MAG: hypothetical protein PHW94_04605, partial [Sulfurimonas sp.]|nr:hypothetical protein [Sulfurimonas sp.]
KEGDDYLQKKRNEIVFILKESHLFIVAANLTRIAITKPNITTTSPTTTQTFSTIVLFLFS